MYLYPPNLLLFNFSVIWKLTSQKLFNIYFFLISHDFKEEYDPVWHVSKEKWCTYTFKINSNRQQTADKKNGSTQMPCKALQKSVSLPFFSSSLCVPVHFCYVTTFQQHSLSPPITPHVSSYPSTFWLLHFLFFKGGTDSCPQSHISLHTSEIYFRIYKNQNVSFRCHSWGGMVVITSSQPVYSLLFFMQHDKFKRSPSF